MTEPEKQIRIGPVVATIYANTGKAGNEEKTYRTVRLHREYTDRYRQVQSTNFLNANDVPKAMLALHRVFEHLMAQATDDAKAHGHGYRPRSGPAVSSETRRPSAYESAKEDWDKR